MSTPPHAGALQWTRPKRMYLLSKRVLTVEKLRQEVINRWEQGTSVPQQPASKKIPVPLLPSESMQEYTHEFEQWLFTKNQSLASLAKDPPRERSMWHSFAYLRAGLINASASKQSLKRSREVQVSSSMRSSKSPQSPEIKRLRRDEPTKLDKTFATSVNASPVVAEVVVAPRFSMSQREGSGNQNALKSSNLGSISRESQSSVQATREKLSVIRPRSRSELLGLRVLSVKAFRHEIIGRKWNRLARQPGDELAKISAPMYPGETIQHYEEQFYEWLLQRDELLSSLQSQPLKERTLRHQFAHWKVNSLKDDGSRDRLHTQPSQTTEQKKSKPDSSVQEDEQPSRCDADKFHNRGKSREALAPGQVPKSVQNLSRAETSGDMRDNEPKLLQLPLISSPQASVKNMKPTLDTSSLCGNASSGVNDPGSETETESENECVGENMSPKFKADLQSVTGPQLLSAEEPPPANYGVSADADADVDSSPQVQTPCGNVLTEIMPSWAISLIGRVQELEREVDQLQEELATARAATR